MNGLTRTPRLTRARDLLLGLGLMLFVSGLWQPNRADAASLHHDHATALAHPAAYHSWSGYVTGGPSVWSSIAHPALNPEIEAAMWKNIRSDPPPHITPLVTFFMWKQHLDAKRFDHYHPKVAKALHHIKAEMASSTPTSNTTTPTTLTQPQMITPSIPTDQAQELTTPEPGTIFIAAGMAVYAIWWRRRHS